MNPDPASLERLHDLALPLAVPWWPPAPGWFVVLGLLLLAGIWLAWRGWKRWQANAYRREALRELAALREASAIAELLRRTALAVAPRPVIAGLIGAAWTDWLATQYPEAMPEAVRTQLGEGIYSRATGDGDVTALRNYAARWIAGHRLAAANARRDG